MKLVAALALPAALLSAACALAAQDPQSVTLACHVNFTSQANGRPEQTGTSDLFVTLSTEKDAMTGYRRVLASHPGSIVSFDTFTATRSGVTTAMGTFRDVSTSGSWTLNRSLKTADSQEFEEVVINRMSGELFYQKQITNRQGEVLYTRNAFGPCVRRF